MDRPTNEGIMVMTKERRKPRFEPKHSARRGCGKLLAIIPLLLLAGGIVLAHQSFSGDVIGGKPHVAHTVAFTCPTGTVCFNDKMVIQDPNSDTGTQWMVEDKKNAPMAWVNLYGLYSGGDGDAMPGGLVCVTYKTSSTVACLTPVGTLQLTPANADGPTGPTETLTASDIAALHTLESSGTSIKKLAQIGKACSIKKGKLLC